MIADGAADGADMAVAFHNQPELPVGDLVFIEGRAPPPAMNSRWSKGVSGHAARPHLASDPIVTAAYLIPSCKARLAPDVAHRSFGADDRPDLGGFTENIIPDSCSFIGTVRLSPPSARYGGGGAAQDLWTAQAMGLEPRSPIGAAHLRCKTMRSLWRKPRCVDRAFPQTPRLETSGDFGAEDFSCSPNACRLATVDRSGHRAVTTVAQPDYQPDEANIAISARALREWRWRFSRRSPCNPLKTDRNMSQITLSMAA